ncbi:MAG: hypothetical protein V7711_13575 [Pseudomonadales bacterium]
MQNRRGFSMKHWLVTGLLILFVGFVFAQEKPAEQEEVAPEKAEVKSLADANYRPSEEIIEDIAVDFPVDI